MKFHWENIRAMKNVLIVKGCENSGKSLFIRSIFIWLLANGFKFENMIETQDFLNYGRCSTLDIYGVCKKDIETDENDVQQKTIAILSAGDNKKIIGLNFCFEEVDILICAANSDKDVSVIRENFPKDNSIEFDIFEVNYNECKKYKNILVEKRKKIFELLNLETDEGINIKAW